jgi:hypothetical protein
MLKFLFWTLLLGNAVLFAYHQGYMQALAPDGREPARQARQLNADKLKLLPASAAAPAASAIEPLLQPVAAAKAAEPAACVEIGSFDAAEARRFETRIAALVPAERTSQHAIAPATADGLRHIVYIPPQGSKEGADRKAAELRQLGIKDFYVIQDGGELRWGISLGIFRNEEAARSHLVGLNQKGVRSARLGPYGAPAARVAFRLRGLDLKAREELDRIGKEFPQQQIRNCGSV